VKSELPRARGGRPRTRAYAPGELLSADTVLMGSLKGIGRVYLHAVVDTYGSHAFGFLHVSKQPEAAVAMLHNDVLPFYRNLNLPVGAVLTHNDREFCGSERHPYKLYLDLNGIEHRRRKIQSPRTKGFVERFYRTVLDEFFRVAMRENSYDRIEALQADLNAWLVHYNTKRLHPGNLGRTPLDTVTSSVCQEGQADTLAT
jgi:transposase InsO family protein